MAELIVKREGATGWIIFSSLSKLNALTYEMWRGIPEAVAEHERDPAVRMVALRGTGDKAFTSGADVTEFAHARDSIGATASYNRAVEDVNVALTNCPKPTLAFIQGICFGGGLGIAARCDIRVCSDDSTFSLPAARLGLGYSYASIMRLAHVVGPAYCAEIMFTGRRYSAEEALQMRLVNRVVPQLEFERVVAEYATMIAENAPLTIAAGKRCLIEGYKDPAQRDMRMVQGMIDTCYTSEDYREGREAFMQKRKPVFRGR
jgi:enoyl-CoA hydratase/carnithine racemase